MTFPSVIARHEVSWQSRKITKNVISTFFETKPVISTHKLKIFNTSRCWIASSLTLLAMTEKGSLQ